MKFAYRTDVGQKRPNNEDYVSVYQNRSGVHFAIVADGMGGHLGGDVASAMAVLHIGYDFEQTTFKKVEPIVSWLVTELQKENQHILTKSQQYADLSGMGTTFVAVIYFQNEYIIANIGDSRAYLYRNGKLAQLTEDHSLVNELVKHGEISKEAAHHHPQKNIITRTLGVSAEADADVTVRQSQYGDYILLCSDGLTNMVSDDEITAVLASELSLQAKCDQLIKQANAAGGLDNITALLLFEDREVKSR
ncbi:protein phosphatase [Loigolactobacillus backii]|uniref:Stp1/IreP family PP2C-type Ser/Thr phosphatase n=1 Tax=Loigolactobacillus backii TaxID=375175 RepID=UPI0007F0FC9C|nr:Stp1/IreP family PP2C-type Ser/Thr phosphatase [Loigolactobacillus backii]ANK64367.1 protein phosphatase [Loigolactobacillus backii]